MSNTISGPNKGNAPVTLVDGISYKTNPETGDHVFEGREADLRSQITAMGFTVDDVPKRHLVTGEVIKDAAQDIYAASGEHAGFITRPDRAVFKAAALPS